MPRGLSPVTYALLSRSAAVALSLLASGCAEGTSDAERLLRPRLEQALDRARATGEVQSATIRVVAERNDVDVAVARGEADPERHVEMKPETRFEIASVAKSMTAALVLRLWESGRLDLDAPVDRYLPDSEVDFGRLHVFEGRSYGREITVRQLLQHTSGLPDWWEDGPRDESGLTEFMRLMFERAPGPWDPRESVRWASTRLSPHFRPGAGFHYSDTNYTLLGLLVERLTGQRLAEAMHDTIFEPLQMRHSRGVDYVRPWRDPEMSHPFIGPLDLTRIDLSFDWAGGGVVSTTADLDRFARGLFGGRLFRHSSTLDEMLRFQEVPPDFRSNGYGLGVELTSTGRVDYVGHYGSVGVLLLYDRENGVSITGTLNQTTPAFGDFVGEVVTAVQETLP